MFCLIRVSRQVTGALPRSLSAALGKKAVSAGDALVPANLNAGSGNAADVVCASDATDMAIPGGVISELMKFKTTALERAVCVYPEGLILLPNRRLHMQAALSGLINLNISFLYYI